MVGGPIVARGSVGTVTRGGCAFLIRPRTGGSRVGRTMRGVFRKAGMGDIGAVGVSKGGGHHNVAIKAATGAGGTVMTLARSDGSVRVFRKLWLVTRTMQIPLQGLYFL